MEQISVNPQMLTPLRLKRTMHQMMKTSYLEEVVLREQKKETWKEVIISQWENLHMQGL